MDALLTILAAGFGAGVINALAGGGTFLTFPALVFAGLPPVAANATSAVAVFPGYIAAAAGFRDELRHIPQRQFVTAVVMSLIGGLAGGILLLISSNEVFSTIVPFLLLAATVAFAFRGPVQRWTAGSRFRTRPYGPFGLIAVAAYGGYFNGGLGIVMLAQYSLWGMTDLNRMNGLKNVLSTVVSAISVATFAVAGIVSWTQALIMAGAAIAGGFAGARLAKALPQSVVRVTIIATGLTMSAVFFARM